MSTKSTKNQLAKLPSVDQLLRHPRVNELLQSYTREFVLSGLRARLDRLREEFGRGSRVSEDREELVERVVAETAEEIDQAMQPSLRRAINATGVILHTGLGRAPLPAAAQENLARAIAGYCTLEIDLESGQRGDRGRHVENLLCTLTGADAACVVNNNAAAVLLVLNTLALGREVIVSRGQLIEIGGSFRIPEVMQRSGAVMVEVGTTNKTHLRDYEQAIGERTALLFAAHWSNFRILGFVKEVPLTELVALGRKHGLPVVHDLGGGVLEDLRQWGLPYEPVVREDVQTGVDVITFSGDKVLGGPQCGIIVGKSDLISRIRANPMMRAVRCDKMTYAALEPTLKLFLRRGSVPAEHPVLRMLTEPVEEVEARSKRLAEQLRQTAGEALEVRITESTAQTGSGALPLEEIPSRAVVLRAGQWSAEQLARRLRLSRPPVVGYIREELLHLDCRTIQEEEIPEIVTVIGELLHGSNRPR